VRKLKNIFVVLEAGQEEQPALERAAFIAEATGSSLHLFMCAYDRAVGIATFLSRSQRSTFAQTIVDGSRVMVERLAEPLTEKEIDFRIEIVWDRHPLDAIIAAVGTGDYGLLMKYCRHSTGVDRMFNHIDWSLMRYSPCPVMLVKKGQWDEVGQVLAAIDAAPENELHEKLNMEILDRASYLAAELNFELHLVSAYPAPPVYVPVSQVSSSLTNYRSKMSHMVIENLNKLGEEYGVLEEHQHAIEGPVDWVIPKVSNDIVAEFVVMGNVSRESLTGISIGSTAESILDQLDTNVMMVRISEQPES